MICAEHIIQLRILSYSIYRSNAPSQRDRDVTNMLIMKIKRCTPLNICRKLKLIKCRNLYIQKLAVLFELFYRKIKLEKMVTRAEICRLYLVSKTRKHDSNSNNAIICHGVQSRKMSDDLFQKIIWIFPKKILWNKRNFSRSTQKAINKSSILLNVSFNNGEYTSDWEWSDRLLEYCDETNFQRWTISRGLYTIFWNFVEYKFL